MSDRGGYDMVLDGVGGPISKLGYRLLRRGGILVVVSAAGMTGRGRRPSYLKIAFEFARLLRVSPLRLIEDNKAVAGLQALLLWDRSDLLGQAMDRLLALAREGKVKPAVGTVLPLDRAAEALTLLHSGTTTGKVVLAC